jgi:hypothetical protein
MDSASALGFEGGNGVHRNRLLGLPAIRQAQSDQRAGERERRDDGDGGCEAVEEGLGRRETAAASEDRCSQRHPTRGLPAGGWSRCCEPAPGATLRSS